MIWAIVAIVVAVVLYRLFSFKARVRSIVKTQLRIYYLLKHSKPNLSETELYKEVIKSRSGFADKVEYIFGLASQLKEQRDGITESWDVNLMWLVMAMCVVETQGGTRASGERLTTIYNVAYRLIPDNL